MKRKTKKVLFRWLKRFGYTSIIVGLVYLCWTPIVRWLIIDQTIKIYKDSKDLYQEEQPTLYYGTITDTTYQKSKNYKNKVDTIVHKQNISMQPEPSVQNGKPNRNEIGLLGDSSAFLNTIFSILAFGGVIATFLYQLRKDSKDKLQASRVQFEQEFFNMTTALENIVSHLSLTEIKVEVVDKKPSEELASFYDNSTDDDDAETMPAVHIEGRAVFKYLYCERKPNNVLSIVNSYQDIRQSEDSLNECFDGSLDHYFRYLYRILLHIDRSENIDELDDPDAERAYYAHLLRAQLSSYELLMWYYNALLGENTGTVKHLIEKYQMLNNLRTWELGRNQKTYDGMLLDHEVTDDDLRIDDDKQYSISAYWNAEELKQFRKVESFKKKESRLIIVTPWLAEFFKKKHSNSSNTDTTESAEEAKPAPIVKPDLGLQKPKQTLPNNAKGSKQKKNLQKLKESQKKKKRGKGH